MSYSVAALLDEGLVFASDSRSTAGADNVAVFSRMSVWEVPGERVIVVLSTGNLSCVQGVIELLTIRAKRADGQPAPEGILGVRTTYEVAQLVGNTLREVMVRERSVREEGVDITCTFIVGGQIQTQRPRLFHIYPEGNFIEAGSDANFFQIGEIKYGKPVIEYVIDFDSGLKGVAKAFLVSFDSTMRANISVGMPIDLIIYERDSLRITMRRRFSRGDSYFSELTGMWSAGLRRVFAELPDIPFER